MPLFKYRCVLCGRPCDRLLAPERANDPAPCPFPSCEGQLERAPTGPSHQAVERLDNGLMPRALERPAEAQRMFEERSRGVRRKD